MNSEKNQEKNQEKTPQNQECKEANCFCDKAQYDEAKSWELKKLQLHLLECSNCREYTEKNTRLTQLIKKAELDSLTKKEREQLKEKLQKELGF